MLTIILGPTASGKTAFSLDLAEKTNAWIISADSMQVYKGMDIGTSKVSLENQKRVRHFLIDQVEPNQDYSVAQFVLDCQKAILECEQNKKNILIVGGTGLYLNALIKGFSFSALPGDENLREKLKALVHEKGLPFLHQELVQKDPDAALKIHPNDEKRIIRALEILELGGKTKSQQESERKSILPEYQIIGIHLEREQLYQQINERVIEMFEKGLIYEIQSLLKIFPPNLKAFQAIGYKEGIALVKEEISKNECLEQIQRHTRQFAKRQMTWFRSFSNIQWITPSK